MKLLVMPWLPVKSVLYFAFSTFEHLLDKGGYKALAFTLLSVVVFWHIYTPIHELLHVAACVLGGGTVEELALQARYGGTLLQPIFPFIVAESDYAGQLTGFTTPNYWVYALVDYFPYVLSLGGLPLMEYARRGARPLLFGVSVILAFIPFFSIPGDYYEAMSLITTQIAEAMDPSLKSGFLISDDVFKSISDLSQAGLLSAKTGGLIFLGLLGALYTTMFTLALQVLLANRIFGTDVFALRQEVGMQVEPTTEGAIP